MNTDLHLNSTYDRDSDVLYIRVKREPAAKGQEDDHGIVWRYGKDGKVVGVTIVDYHDLWHARRDELATLLSDGLTTPKREVKRVLVD